ncbi:alpha/beta fold hydrolase [Nocardia crassostreae]|uniref:alpha/beta fold hydrolase n=1 Tax=Nocardia crassostreae TaxID=53428 RepID=UPI000A02F7BE|nr:alpha/beta hydrolase [Nocardia crassostreae]
MKTFDKPVYAAAAAALSALLLTACGTGAATDADRASTSITAAPVADKPSADGKGFYAPVNGLQLYYEVHGTGTPLVLVHGGLSDGESSFGALLPELAKTRKVITVDLQAHGRTADIDRPLRFETLADDIAALIGHKADVLGYSLGGGVAFQLTARTPDLVNKVIITSSPYRYDGWKPDTLAGMAAMNPDNMLETPMHALYAKVAPNPTAWSSLVTKTRTLLTEPYDWTPQLAAVKAHVLLVTAEDDALHPAHAEEFITRLGGSKTDPTATSRLAVVPGTTHYDIMYRADLLLPVITPFLGTSA